MATISTSNHIATAVSSVFEGSALVNDDWSAIYDVRRDDVGSLRLAALQGMGNFAAWTDGDDVTTETPTSYGHNTLSYTAYAMQVKIPRYLARDVPGLLEMASRKVGVSIASTYRAQAWSSLSSTLGGSSAFATLHSLDICSAAHPCSDGTTRSNLGTSAQFDQAALEGAVTSKRQWKNAMGQKYDLADYPMYLCVSPSNEMVARKLLFSGLTTGASGIHSNESNPLGPTGNFGIRLLVNPESDYDGDNDDWHLITDPSFVDPALTFWERGAPEIAISTATDDGSTRIFVSFAIVASTDGPTPDQLFGNVV